LNFLNKIQALGRGWGGGSVNSLVSRMLGLAGPPETVLRDNEVSEQEKGGRGLGRHSRGGLGLTLALPQSIPVSGQ
jgi:hypothetical protein